jgi:hypothetical protein
MNKQSKAILKSNKRSLTAALNHANSEHKKLCKENMTNRMEYQTQKLMI